MNKKFKKICVLKGGISSEREVSLVSGSEMAKAAGALGYEVVEFDFTGDLPGLISFVNREKPDCILNGLHGIGGEDGNIQAVLNFLKIPYTHSGVLASAIGMNKAISESIFQRNGIRVPKSALYSWKEFCEHPDFPTPFVIKPVDGGSSCGVYIIRDISELGNIEWTHKDVYVSEYIPGLELTVGVLDGRAMAVTNIVVNSGFYDYTNKYTDGKANHELPAKIPEEIYSEALRSAEKMHKLIGGRGVTRSDFRYNTETNQLFALEINTQPGMTPLSLVPEQAKLIGMSFEELIERIIDTARVD
ncbi:MAG: D-alanine--D-alanine ligase [Alphaproteobacteria bacterium]|nr:D-alanine--D-alanine ligase [Alphaproteobacteria bacterium]